MKQGQFQAAEGHLREWIAIDPNDPVAYNLLGIVLGERGDLSGAARAFEEALGIDPSYQTAKNNLERVREAGALKRGS